MHTGGYTNWTLPEPTGEGKANQAKHQTHSTPTKHREAKGHRHARAATTATPTAEMGAAKGRHKPGGNHHTPPRTTPNQAPNHNRHQRRLRQGVRQGQEDHQQQEQAAPITLITQYYSGGGGTKLPKSDCLLSPNGSEYCTNLHFHTCNNSNCRRDHTCLGCGKGQHPLSQCCSI